VSELSAWDVLEQRRAELLARRDELLSNSYRMEPDIAARALSVLADELDALAEDYARLQRQKGEPN
jgi:hypothetical protein